MALPTSNIGLNRPDHGDFPDTWEIPVNANSDTIDALFDSNPTVGHIHDGTAGQGPQIDHDDLLNKGTVPHSTLDVETGKVKITAADTTADYVANELVAGSNIAFTVISPGADEKLQIAASSVPPTLGDPTTDPSGEYGWKSFVSTSPPIAYTDNFCYPPSFSLTNADYATSQMVSGGGNPIDFFTTGYSAQSYVDPAGKGDAAIAKYTAMCACHIPHSPAQRATVSITNFDYADLKEGDFVSFVLALYGTHDWGVTLPHKLGVFLEIHFVKNGSATYQVSHRITVAPDSSTQVLLWQCDHTDPGDIEGCWEISLDQNGHVYHYWRRQLVWSSQTSPPSATGPVAAYFSTLNASLLANGDPDYGAMGFGCQHDISPLSKYDMEIRWLALTSTADIYEPALCPGTLPPVGIPTIEDVPEEFWFAPPGGPGPGIPGQDCCPDPPGPPMTIGTPIGLFGDPITECNSIPTDTGSAAGYKTASMGGCNPCEISNYGGTPIPSEWPDDWADGLSPKESTLPGEITETAVSLLPWKMEVTSLTSGLEIIDWAWHDYNTFSFAFNLNDGTAGTDFEIRVANPDIPANYVDLNYGTIVETEVEFVSWTATEDYSKVAAGVLTESRAYNMTFNMTGANAGTSIEASAGTVSSIVVVDASTITFDWEIPYGEGGTTATITIIDPIGDETTTIAIGYITPVYADGSLTGSTSPSGTGSVVITVWDLDEPGHTAASPDLTLSTEAYNPVTHEYTADYLITGASGNVVVTFTNTASGFAADCRLMLIGSHPANTITTTVTVPSGVAFYKGRKDIKVRCTGTFSDQVLAAVTLPALGNYDLAGNVRLTLLNSTTVEFLTDVDSTATGNVDVTIYSPDPGLGDTDSAAFVVQSVPTLTASIAYGSGLSVGTAGVATVTGSGIITETSVSSSLPTKLIVSAWVQTDESNASFNYEVASDVDGESVDVTITESLSGQTDIQNDDLGLQPPTITSIDTADRWEINRTIDLTITGTEFDVTGLLVVIGASLNSHTILSATEIEANVTLPASPGTVNFEIQNSDGQTDDDDVTVNAESTPEINHAEGDPQYTGFVSEIRWYGHNLDSEGLVVNYTNFTPSSTDITRTYVASAGTITGSASSDVTAMFESTDNPGGYGPFTAFEIEAVPTPAVTITSIIPNNPMENSTAVAISIVGTNLDTIVTPLFLSRVPEDSSRINLNFNPNPGAPLGDAVTVASIVTQTPTLLDITIDIQGGLYPRWFTFKGQDGGGLDLVVVDQAIQPTPYTGLEYVTDELLVDAAAITTSGTTYQMSVPVSGNDVTDFWEIDGGSIVTQTWVALNSAWDLTITNSVTPGTAFELRLVQPSVIALPDGQANYRYPGGVTT